MPITHKTEYGTNIYKIVINDHGAKNCTSFCPQLNLEIQGDDVFDVVRLMIEHLDKHNKLKYKKNLRHKLTI